MRIVEVERAPCQHLHSSNYDYTAVVRGMPVVALPDGQHRCFDCGQVFTPQVPPRRYTLAQLETLAEQWAIENKILATERWNVSCLLAWLKKKEREAQGD